VRFLRRYQNYRVESATLQKQMPTVDVESAAYVPLEIALALVCLDHITSRIVNMDHSIM
jgi:hypothetical protein